VMNYEIDELIDGYRSRSGDVLISTDFNIPIISILWQIVAGSRITLEDSESVKMVDLVTEIFSKGNADFGLQTKIVCSLYFCNLMVQT